MNTTARLSIVPLGLTLGCFFVISYVGCVLYGILGFQQGMHQFFFSSFPDSPGSPGRASFLVCSGPSCSAGTSP